MAPLFTVGIPVYNGMPYLPEAMESVLTQPFDDCEILVINDGSSDGSLDYLKSIRDRRLRVVSQKNRGLTPTLNRLLQEARSPWLVRLDADDVSSPDRLKIVAEQITRWPDSGMFYSRAKLHQQSSAVSLNRTTGSDSLGVARADRWVTCYRSACHSSVVLNIPKTHLALGGYRFNLHIEDLDLWWRMALALDIVFIPEITVAYRLNSGGICATHLGELECETLYAQYLLLSQLWNKPAHSYLQVQSVLQSFLEQRRLVYRELHRCGKAAIAVSARKYARAGRHMVVAACSDPSRFLERALYPIKRPAKIKIGAPPEAFRKNCQQLWPA